jgi:hypothetical protein
VDLLSVAKIQHGGNSNSGKDILVCDPIVVHSSPLLTLRRAEIPRVSALPEVFLATRAMAGFGD